MKIQINLATHPFVELRPLFARLRIAMAVLAVLAAGLGFALHSMSAKAEDAQHKMAALKEHTARLQDEKLSNEVKMRQPQNAAVLERSRFLNLMFARKSFSWTAVMMDLEDVLPAGVQVTSIEPSITADGDVNIRLKVSGDRDRAVQLVRNLETSKRFLLPRLSDESMKTQTEGAQRATVGPAGVEFDILAGYNPLPIKPKDDAGKDSKAVKDTGTGNKPTQKTAKPAVKKATVVAPGAKNGKSTAVAAKSPAGKAKSSPAPAGAVAPGGKR